MSIIYCCVCVCSTYMDTPKEFAAGNKSATSAPAITTTAAPNADEETDNDPRCKVVCLRC